MRAKGSEATRRILCVFPRYTSAFGTFEHAYPLTDGGAPSCRRRGCS